MKSVPPVKQFPVIGKRKEELRFSRRPVKFLHNWRRQDLAPVSEATGWPHKYVVCQKKGERKIIIEAGEGSTICNSVCCIYALTNRVFLSGFLILCTCCSLPVSLLCVCVCVWF